MKRRTLLVALLISAASPIFAQSVKLKTAEIAVLLTGNTAVGSWKGVKYRQYFDSDGSTIYAQEGSRSTRGDWRIDPKIDEYQSIWPGDASWEGWYVMEYLGTYYWVSKSTPPTPFKILEGQQLTAPTKPKAD